MSRSILLLCKYADFTSIELIFHFIAFAIETVILTASLEQVGESFLRRLVSSSKPRATRPLCTRFLLRVSREIMRKCGRKSVDFIRRFHLGNFSARALPLGMLHFQLITTGAYIEFSPLFFINYFKQMMKYKNMFINLCNSFIKPQKLDINSGMIF